MGPSPTTTRRDYEIERIPVLVTNGRTIADWLKPADSSVLAFRTVRAAEPADLAFRPFYSLTHERYGVYFDCFTPAEWDSKETAYRAEEERLRDLRVRTVDEMTLGQMQPERDHNLAQNRNDVRDANGRSFRTPLVGGWVEFDMRLDSGRPQELVLTYWGNDRIRPEFDICVDGRPIATDQLSGRPNNQFYDVAYALPTDMTTRKTKVRIRIQPHEGHTGPSVAEAKMVLSKP
jgi:hypothetical protein